MTDREIRGHLEEIYEVEMSPDLISWVTNAVLEEVREWQNRPLDKSYAIVYLDALRVRGRIDKKLYEKRLRGPWDEFRGKKGGCGLKSDGLWIAETEGADGCVDGAKEPRRPGHPDSLHGRAFRLPWRGVPADPRAAVHSAHGAQLDEVRLVQGS